MSIDLCVFFIELFNIVVVVGYFYQVLVDYLLEDCSGCVIVIGVGKVVGVMVEVVEKYWQGEIQGLVVVFYCYGV